MVTGGSRGIDAAIAALLAAEGADVGYTQSKQPTGEASTLNANDEHGCRGLAVQADHVVEAGRIESGRLPASRELSKSLGALTILGRIGITADIAAAVAFLVGPDAGYLTAPV
jgi:NAD(P)-dependent dehydrogenase (short-subunit alcohol dehydrogenase family)